MLINESTLRRIIREEYRRLNEQAEMRKPGVVKVGQATPLGMPGTAIDAGNWKIPAMLADKMRNDATFLQVHAGAGAGAGQVTLRQGSKGSAVRIYQELLQFVMNAAGQPLPAGFKVDGDYGPSTVKATVAFQKYAGVPVDGVVGRNIIAAMIGRQAQITGKTGLDTAPAVMASKQVPTPDTVIGRNTTAKDVNTVMNLIEKQVGDVMSRYKDTTSGYKAYGRDLMSVYDNILYACKLAKASWEAASASGVATTRKDYGLIVSKLAAIGAKYRQQLDTYKHDGNQYATLVAGGLLEDPTGDMVLNITKRPYVVRGAEVGNAEWSAGKGYMAGQASNR